MRLLMQLEEFNQRMQAINAHYALIGGLALSAHQLPRATQDIDFLVRKTDAERAHALVLELGYHCLHRSEDAANYRRGEQALDFIYAHRPRAVALIDSAQAHEIGTQRLPVVGVAGLIGLKLQAVTNDPSRTQDLIDIAALFCKHRATLDLIEVRDYFQLFDQTTLYDKLINSPAK
jgi:hypothetical protein